jgi:hypothetical protein
MKLMLKAGRVSSVLAVAIIAGTLQVQRTDAAAHPSTAAHTVAGPLPKGALKAQGMPSTGQYTTGDVPGRRSTASLRRPLMTMSTTPTAVDLSQWDPPVGNQGGVQSCSAWSTGYYLRGWYARRDGYYPGSDAAGTGSFSPMYTYSQLVNGQNTGTRITDNLNIQQSQGIDTRSDYWQGTGNYTQPPTQAETVNADQCTIFSSWDMTSSSYLGGWQSWIQSYIEQTLASGHPVVIAFPVYANFKNLNSTNYYYSSPSGKNLGNHAAFALAYDNNGLWIENSWGTGWAANGYAELSWSFSAIDGYVNRRGHLVMDGQDLGRLPAPRPPHHPTGGDRSGSSAHRWSRCARWTRGCHPGATRSHHCAPPGGRAPAARWRHRRDQHAPQAGFVFFPAEEAHDVLRRYRDYTDQAPDEVTTIYSLRWAPAAPFLPEHVHGRKVVAVGACYAGDPEVGEPVVAPLRHLGTPLADILERKPFVVHQKTVDPTVPHFNRYYWKSHYLLPLSDSAIDTMIDHAWRVPSPLSYTIMFQLGGVVSRAGEMDTAYGNRDASYTININANWTDTAADSENIAWAREYFAAMEPFSTGGVYVNFMGNEGEERVRAAYGEQKYERLAALKRKYDPSNFFRLNQNITPRAG